jgi:hypothetical protein
MIYDPGVQIAQSLARAACTWKLFTLVRRGTGGFDSYIEPWHVESPSAAQSPGKADTAGRFSSTRPCSSHFDLRLRFFVFLGEALREAAAVFSTAKSSSFAPALSFSRSQRG